MLALIDWREFSKESLWQDLLKEIVLLTPQIVSGVVVFLLFWLVAVVVRRVVIRVGTNRGIDRDLARFMGRAARVALLLVGAIMALGTIGIDIAALVAGLGLTGFALGFALKDIVSNVLAGILILIYKPFQRDDHITIKSFQGKVTTIDLRYTVLSSDEKEIFVPNSILFTDAITVQKHV